MDAFSSLCLSAKTKRGLDDSHFAEMSEIQQKVIPECLKGDNIFAVAPTGSGKTLAFIIPLLERLNTEKWNRRDGLGALVISPTRELAVQTFKVLRSVGKHHDFSAGLVIGGKNLKQEQQAVGSMNILIATPGRLLQHLDQNASLNCDNLRLLVLDEADRILDLGFSKTIKCILEFLPKSRQTLLFSATETKDVNSLARAFVKNYNVIKLEEHGKNDYILPSNLENYFVRISHVGLKLEYLFSFLRYYSKSKILVFVSSCKQVRFVYETFCKLRPGIPLLALHGRQKQHQRLEVFEKFTVKSNSALICTDIASRGLDFPSVDWVVQLDCPHTLEDFIHRSGRTARFKLNGKALLLLLPFEEEFFMTLQKSGIKMKDIKEPFMFKKQEITSVICNIVSQNSDIKYLAQKAVLSYYKSCSLKINYKPDEQFLCNLSKSYGLSQTPKIEEKCGKAQKNMNRSLLK